MLFCYTQPTPSMSKVILQDITTTYAYNILPKNKVRYFDIFQIKVNKTILEK